MHNYVGLKGFGKGSWLNNITYITVQRQNSEARKFCHRMDLPHTGQLVKSPLLITFRKKCIAIEFLYLCLQTEAKY
jgi:hypothetical protein